MEATKDKVDLLSMKERAQAWATERLEDPDTLILDIESTGLPSQDPDVEICQLALVDTKGKPVFAMLLKPNKPMGDVVMGIHGITNKQVENQPTFPQVAKIIEFILKDKHLIAFNAEFDVSLLWGLYRKYELPVPQTKGISCAMDKYGEFLGEWDHKRGKLKWQKLPNLSGMAAHDAFSDCVSTLRVIELISGQYDPSKIEADSIDLDF